jgi:hypothetical protein
MMALGNTSYNATPPYYYGIGLGYFSSNIYIQPAEIGFVARNNTGGTYGDFYIATRDNGTQANPPIQRMCVTNTGNVGIGTTNPQANLHVNGLTTITNGSGNSTTGLTGLIISTQTGLDATTTDSVIIQQGTANASSRQALTWRNTNIQNYTMARIWSMVGGGYSATTMGIDVADSARNIQTRFMINEAGTVYLSAYTTNGTLSTIGGNGGLTVSSDNRLKQQVSYLTNDALQIIAGLKPASFEYIVEHGVKRIGFIAQDVEQILPEAVDGKKYEFEFLRHEDGTIMMENGHPLLNTEKPRYRGLDYNAIVSILVKATQELKSENEDLRRAIIEIKQQIGMQ